MSIQSIPQINSFIYDRAFKILKCHHHAQDISQQVLIKFNKQIEKDPLMDEKYKKSWLTTVTKNQCFKVLAKDKKLSIIDPEDLEEKIGSSPSPYETLDEREQTEFLLQCLKESLKFLSEKQRLLIHLQYIERLSYKQISERTGLGKGNIGFILNRAMTKLRIKMYERTRN